MLSDNVSLSLALFAVWLAGKPATPQRTFGYKRAEILAELAGIHGERWPELHDRILSAIRQVEERGFCIVDGEWRRNTRTVAAPLVSQDGNTVMAMSCGGPIFSITLERMEQELGPRLTHICTADSLYLGN